MLSSKKADSFIKQVYKNVWQNYDQEQMQRYYHRNMTARSCGQSFCFEEMHELLKLKSCELNYMQPEFHQTIVQDNNKFVSWFTSIHYDHRGCEIYRINTMASYTIKADKIATLEFMWDKPIDFVMSPLQLSLLYIQAFSKFTKEKLSKRELQIFFYVVRGYSAKMIAKKLNISHRTVETHISSVKSKLQLHNSRDIVEFAFAHGLASLEPIYSNILEHIPGDKND